MLFLQWTPNFDSEIRVKNQRRFFNGLDWEGDTKVVFDKFDSRFWSSRFMLAPRQRWF